MPSLFFQSLTFIPQQKILLFVQIRGWFCGFSLPSSLILKPACCLVDSITYSNSTTPNILTNSRTTKYLLKIAPCFLQVSFPTFSLLSLLKTQRFLTHLNALSLTGIFLQQNPSPASQPALHHQMMD